VLTGALVVSLVVLALAACGGASGLTKAQYDAKVSHLCLVAASQVGDLHMDNSIGAWRHSGADVVRIAQHFDNSVAALKAPGAISSVAASTLHQIAVRAGKDGAATFPAAKAIGATGCYIS
jgi:hypothetical protein